MSKVVMILVLIWIVWVIGFPFGHAFAVTFWWDTKAHEEQFYSVSKIDFWAVESELEIDEARELNTKAEAEVWGLVKRYLEI